MAITPLNDRVLLKRVAGEEKSAGGIIIPDTAKEKPQEGKIIAVGPGKLEKGERLALTVKVGDRVLFGKYSGTEVNFGGEELVLLREEEIFAVIGFRLHAVRASSRLRGNSWQPKKFCSRKTLVVACSRAL